MKKHILQENYERLFGKQSLREEMDLLKEASAFSKLGATKKQVKAAHNDFPSVQFAADSKFEKITNKKELTSILKSDDGKGWFSVEAIVGFDKSGNMTLAGGTNRKSFSIKKIDVNGKTLETWTEKAPGRIIARFQGIKVYYISRQGSFEKSSGYKSTDTRNYTNQIAEIGEKFIKSEFNKIKKDIKTKMKNLISKEDFVELFSYADLLIKKVDWGEYEAKSVDDLFNSMGSWNIKTIETLINDRAKDALAKAYDYNWNTKDIPENKVKNIARKVVSDMVRELRQKLEL